ncbi:MAG: VWA domain-containing protein, partial [Thermomicrobiales bacterium]|nr:VWA domain-containing protein [Thermomicrobiales bacterium]
MQRFNLRAPLLAVLVAILFASLLAPAMTRAEGIVIVEPPGCEPTCPEPTPIGDQLEIKRHTVEVAIEDGIANTRVDQIFHNPNRWAAEGTYIFPVPAGAAVSEFKMWVDGAPVDANLLDADEARRIYEEIVRARRDPALLEFIGEGAVQASIFPIPPGADRRIEIAYAEIVPTENGLSRYRFGLNSGRFSAQSPESSSIRVSIAADQPLQATYSPSHDVAIDRIDDRHTVVGWESSGAAPAADFDLYWSASPDPIGVHLVGDYDPAVGEGYLLLLASPGFEAETKSIAKDVILVLDTSGSMQGEKIIQARQALVSVLERLGAEDRFAVVEFSTGVRRFAPELIPTSQRAEAINWVKTLPAEGGTDIDRALLEALTMVRPERPTTLIFLTDGLPTEGETDVARILRNIDDAAPDNVRLFTFGVGDDVDTLLLDGLSTDHHGRSTYVRPGQSLDEAVSAFYAGISAPVLADLKVDWGNALISDVSPDPLPDLFAGSQLVVVGRYTEGGATTITLTGTVDGERRTYAFPNQILPTARGDGWLPRLWATRRIGYLLNQIRLSGENRELVDEIVRLSVRFGIVTPYTSYLLTEDDILSEEGRTRVAQDVMTQAAQPAPVSG